MRKWSPIVLACLLAASPVATAQAQPAYPAKPIRMVVPFAAGGPTDVFARAVGREIAATLGQPVVIENRPGAGGNLGADIVAKSPPDGYTIVMGATGAFSVNVTLDPKLPYDVLRDFAPVSLVATIPFVLVVHPSVPVKSVDDLVRIGKAKPGELSFGSAGTGTSMHMASELFKTMTGANIIHVPYKGAAPAVTDLVAGHIQLIFADMVSALPHVRAGRLRAIAVTQRSPLYPDVPTFAEAGLPGYDASAWYAIFAPAGTPKEIVSKLSAATANALQTPELRERLANDGAQPVGSTPEELDRFVRGEIAKWAKVVKASGLKPD